jgi:[NiFe] hydrogenase diaphorase moiety large subunit
MSPIDRLVIPVLERHRREPGRLLQILRDIQSEAGWISPEIAAATAGELGLPKSRVDALVQFYAFLYDRPVGRYRVLFSDNITDQMQGSIALREHMLRRLRLRQGETSADGLVSVDVTSCTGMSDQGPALLVNSRPVARLTPRRIDEICDLIRDGEPVAEWPAHLFHIDDDIRRADALLASRQPVGDALRLAVAMGPQGVIDEMRKSNLRGRGGAGFTTAVKWDGARRANADDRYVICNADEGEPGTFKDRVLLASYAERVFEGMVIAAFAIGARKGFVYLRGEYEYLRAPLEAKLADLRRRRLLGASVGGAAGFDFDIEIHMGAGAYICGEETALIESLEGKPGRPRIRPPFPSTRGYDGRPTVVNNVETLCRATEVILMGGARYAGLGTKQSTGTKLLSVSGDCERPGIYEYPFGVRVSTVLEDCGALEPGAVQVSGPAGECLAPHEFSRRISFEDVPTAGSFMVFSRHRDMFEVARNFTHFFAHESCGFCTPCRVGCALMKDLMDKVAAGRGAPYEINEMKRLRDVLRTSSHCGLGLSAANPVFDTVQKFPAAYERRLIRRDFEPAFDLDAALDRARDVVGREDAEAHLGTDA